MNKRLVMKAAKSAKKLVPAKGVKPKATQATPTEAKASIKPATKGEVYTKLASKTGLSKKKISTGFESCKATRPKATIKPATKGEVYTKLASKTGLSKKQISTVFESLTDIIGDEGDKKGRGLPVVPGLLKHKVVRKPATKAKRVQQETRVAAVEANLGESQLLSKFLKGAGWS